VDSIVTGLGVGLDEDGRGARRGDCDGDDRRAHPGGHTGFDGKRQKIGGVRVRPPVREVAAATAAVGGEGPGPPLPLVVVGKGLPLLVKEGAAASRGRHVCRERAWGGDGPMPDAGDGEMGTGSKWRWGDGEAEEMETGS